MANVNQSINQSLYNLNIQPDDYIDLAFTGIQSQRQRRRKQHASANSTEALVEINSKIDW